VAATKNPSSYTGWSGQSVETTVKPPSKAAARTDEGR
jgi:hypothetical protein